MPDQIDLIDPGETITAAWLNQIVSAVNAMLAMQVAGGLGHIVWGDENGIIELHPETFGGGGGFSRPGGFMCEASGSGIRVYLGLLNSISPEGMTLGDVAPFVIAPAGADGKVCLEVEVYDDSGEGDTGDFAEPGSIRTVKIKCFADGDSSADDTDTKFYLALGTYGHLGGTLLVTPGGQGNGVGDQSFELCGGLGGTAQWGPA
jgi:hypothetical protein